MVVLWLTVSLMFLGMVADLGRIWVLRGEVQRALDAAALAGASNVTVYVEIDKYGNIYDYFVEPDPVRAEADARDTFALNTSNLKDVTIDTVTVTIEDTKVTVTSNFRVKGILLPAFIPSAASIDMQLSASADCTLVPLAP